MAGFTAQAAARISRAVRRMEAIPVEAPLAPLSPDVSQVDVFWVRPTAGPVQIAFDATEADDTLTSTAHGLADGDQVKVYAPAAPDTLPDGLTEGSSYYVVNGSADDFQLSDTMGGSAIDLTTDGSGYVVLLWNGHELALGSRWDYSDAGDPTGAEQEAVWIYHPGGRPTVVDEWYMGRRHGEHEDGTTIYTVQIGVGDSGDCTCQDEIDALQDTINSLQDQINALLGANTICDCPDCPDGVPKYWLATFSGFGDDPCCTQLNNTFSLAWTGEAGVYCEWTYDGGDFVIRASTSGSTMTVLVDWPGSVCSEVAFVYDGSLNCCGSMTLTGDNGGITLGGTGPGSTVCLALASSVTLVPSGSCVACP